MAKNQFRKLVPEVEVNQNKIPVSKFKSIYVGGSYAEYSQYMTLAHETFVKKYPMHPQHADTEEYKEFFKSKKK
jgi:hypothetical protein